MLMQYQKNSDEFFGPQIWKIWWHSEIRTSRENFWCAWKFCL